MKKFDHMIWRGEALGWFALIQERPGLLRGREVQMITEIVDNELGPGETYESEWHVEGMSHKENATTVERDNDNKIDGIRFKWAFRQRETTFIICRADKMSPPNVATIVVDKCLDSIDKAETQTGPFFMIPNSHVHKVTEIKNASSMGDGSKKK